MVLIPLQSTINRALSVLFIGLFVFSQTLYSQDKNENLVRFDENWAEFDVYEGGLKGVRIHTKFTVYNLKGINSQLAIAVEYETGEKIYGINSDFKSTNGQLTIYKKLNLDYDSSFFKDVSLFLPYQELNLGYGKHDLRFHVDLLYGDNNNIHLSYYNWYYTK
ncbi:MAG: hypothetical protein DRI75_04085 [Bacteroidetes bacterium]|nr:MAG: hypothetical protein DRI75_04085 [Bacteroidota bacterium]